MNKNLSTITLMLALIAPSASLAQQTAGEVCRSYALAIEAVAQARDNLDDPSWEKLLELHPVLRIKKNKENVRAVLHAQLINMRMTNKNVPPQALKMSAYEMCQANYSCMFHNTNCGKK